MFNSKHLKPLDINKYYNIMGKSKEEQRDIIRTKNKTDKLKIQKRIDKFRKGMAYLEVIN